MKIGARFLLSIILSVGLIYLLEKEWTFKNSTLPKLGYFFSPFYGFWQNAEAKDQAKFYLKINKDDLIQPASVYIDVKMVPHIFAKNIHDLYFLQGYVHAKFRLWQMDFITKVASGRLSEVFGEKTINIDKYFRRLGMNYGAENALKNSTKSNKINALILEAYSAGINSYIANLKANDLPLEYKLLNYRPEKWTPIKSYLFLMYLSYDLTGAALGIELGLTNSMDSLGQENFYQFYGDHFFEFPIIPRGTNFLTPKKVPIKPEKKNVNFISENSNSTSFYQFPNPDKDNGSNNWAVTGKKSKSGQAILCNDPHLKLSLPSIWFENQISLNNKNCYGVSFPGIPGIVIGFNDSIAWGLTNSGRDVIDTYELTLNPKDSTEYLFNKNWLKANQRIEKIKIKNKKTIHEKILLTKLGLLTFTNSFSNERSGNRNIAVNWTAHHHLTEILAIFSLNFADNLPKFKDNLRKFTVPGQNFIMADVKGNIGLFQQGKFIAKWKRQGDVTAPGIDSSYLWQGFIPFEENPNIFSPSTDFLSSANQIAADPNKYPYYLGVAELYNTSRSEIINKILTIKQNFDLSTMMQMQTNSYNIFAEKFKDIFVKNMDTQFLDKNEMNYFNIFRNWDCTFRINDVGATIADFWWTAFYKIMNSHIPHYNPPFASENIDRDFLLSEIIKDKNFLSDNSQTFLKENISVNLFYSFKNIIPKLDSLRKNEKLGWFKYNPLIINHLISELGSFGKKVYPLSGSPESINSIKPNLSHGPSWRMIVEMGPKIKALGVYPGGQSGNPGSYFYDNFISSWANGNYYKILFDSESGLESNSNIVLKYKFKE